VSGTAVIVGAGSGLSASLTRLFRKEGLAVAIAARETTKLAALTNETGARAYACDAQDETQVLVTHGTDTMVETAKVLATIPGKTIVLTGALNPARFRGSDAEFNIGTAVGAVQSLPPGVFIAMNGRIWDPAKVRKNVDANRFEAAG